MTKQLLPNNDDDLKLSRWLGKALETGDRQPDTGDPLLDMLRLYKEKRHRQAQAVTTEESSRMWENISDEMDPAERSAPIYEIGKGNNRSAWAAAASILVIACIGIYYYVGFQPQPQLIASSEQQIETVVLDDGSTVQLRPHSSLFAVRKNSSEQSYKLEGEAFFDVKSRSGRTFSVRAGSGNVVVTGTRFDVSNWGGQTQVYLEEGSVRFENMNTDESVTLHPGQSAVLQSGNPIDASYSLQGREFTDWLDKELHFENKTAAYVFSELEQEFGIRIIAEKAVISTTLSGALSMEDREQSLKDLGLVLDGKFISIDEQTYKFIPNDK